MEQHPALASSSHLKQACEMQAGSGSQKHVSESVRFLFPLPPLLFLTGNFYPQQSEEKLLKISFCQGQSIWPQGEMNQGLELPEEV